MSTCTCKPMVMHTIGCLVVSGPNDCEHCGCERVDGVCGWCDGEADPLPQADVTPPDTRSEVETLAEVMGDIRVEQARQEDWWTSDADHVLLARVLRGECAAWAPGVLAAGYAPPARHDADIAAAKAAGAAEAIAQVGAVLGPILANIEHALATGQAGAFPAPTAWALTADAIRAALTTGGDG